MKNIFLAIVITCFTSCAFHTGNVSTGSNIDCPLMYIATGTASSTRVLGLGGIDKDELIVDAKKDLYRKYPYSKGVKLSNFSVDFKNTYVFIVHTTKVTVSADVYNCTVSLDTIDENSSIKINGFKIGDEVLFVSFLFEYVPIKAKIINHLVGNMVNIGDNNDKLAKNGMKVSYDNIFRAVKDPENVRIFGLDIGDNFKISVVNYATDIKYKTSCKIIGINLKSAIVEFVNTKGKISNMVVEKNLLHK
jgi:hypothetical protein